MHVRERVVLIRKMIIKNSFTFTGILKWENKKVVPLIFHPFQGFAVGAVRKTGCYFCLGLENLAKRLLSVL